jgi:glycosyltransferase involved in cell wall biosynthesis
MSAVTARMADLLTEDAAVRRLSISPSSLTRSPTYHAQRVVKVARTALSLLRHGRPTTPVLLACDAGLGMYYTAALAWIARHRGCPLFIQHHSYAYAAARRRRMATLQRRAGRDAVHLVACERMARDFAASYPGLRTEILPVSLGIDPAVSTPATNDRATARLRVGLLSNLTESKGVTRVFEAAAAAVARGVDLELAIAGPVVTGEDSERLEKLLAAHPETRYEGPVYGPAKDEFLDNLDVFVFPSTYVNECYPLVVWEAMLHGCALLAYEVGCLTQAAVGAGGVVVNRETDFATAAAEQLAAWQADPAALTKIRLAAREVARQTVTNANAQARAFVTRFVGSARDVRS